ncbi:phosphatidylserine decarboxylase [Desulfomicrobium norvegicum]|uniref:Phosphatidylserine decarboxylase n=1 Tax=Desulfomicrobium norvegicum (strain DSM 1741 / NCIMB 8310) TaxID=52561 RepID=A0A8G2C1X9_DESNO|nr:phosphatidylserine decarboxylase [Desulfomicrobium norvegicum]SFL56554.1 phosphatidylserine decarboxylase [Desulfomicrobium norvegicum]
MTHQYIARDLGSIRDEELFCDRVIDYLYSRVREKAPVLFDAVTSARASSLLGFVNYDLPLGARISGASALIKRLGIDISECVEAPSHYNTARRIFERRIRYETVRPMTGDQAAVVSPADSRMFTGSLSEESVLFIKDKFFSFEEFLGRPNWNQVFAGGDFAIFRLTPDKYHYNHVPVSGVVRDFYEIEGAFHSCNPTAVISEVTPFSRNRRAVTIIDTDVPGGSGCGQVAMVEVAALMIGQIVQAYASSGYDPHEPVRPGLFLRMGQPKSLYRPGSSLDVLIFEPGRVEFSPDLVANQFRGDVGSRFSSWLGRPWVETDVRVRESIGRVLNQNT